MLSIQMLVSIIIPTYNRAKTIAAVVESALAQTYRETEIIVVDDGSSDDTADALKPYLERIQYIYQDNSGPSAARNRGVAAASGEVLAFLDSDDFWLPEKIEKQIAVFRAVGPDLCCVICSASVESAAGAKLGNTFEMSGLKLKVGTGVWSNPQEVLATRFILFNQVVAVRRWFFDSVGGFNENLRLLEDYELAMKLSTCGPWGVIREPLVVKYNDDDGIGVDCMMDEDRHLKACIEVMTGIHLAGHGLNSTARHLLGVELSDMRDEMKIRALMRRGGGMTSVAKLLSLGIRARKAIRRRLPSWPQPDVRPILE
jgi:glycosyltransferase involved in cell wall biosynthesis